jgi:hypothetical protein
MDGKQKKGQDFRRIAGLDDTLGIAEVVISPLKNRNQQI